MAVGCHEPSFREEQHGHEKRARHHQAAARPSVDEQQCRNRHPNADDILDRSRQKGGVARQTGHLEDIHDVIHHGVRAGILRPYMGENGAVDANNIAWLEQLEP